MDIYTIGFAKKTAGEFFGLLRGAGQRARLAGLGERLNRAGTGYYG